jgi:hypothetical protein
LSVNDIADFRIVCAFSYCGEFPLAVLAVDFSRNQARVNIYDCVRRKQDFGMIQNAFIRVVDQANREELVTIDDKHKFINLSGHFRQIDENLFIIAVAFTRQVVSSIFTTASDVNRTSA